jgi:hypothetical protein
MKMIYTPSKIPIQLPLETSTTTGHAARPRGFLVRTDRWLHPCMELTVQRSVPTPTYYRQYRVVRSKYSRKQQDMIDQYQETAGYDRSVPFER